jgi:hypothetical protein
MFRDALLEAQALGAISLRFDVDLSIPYSEEDRRLRWVVHANVPTSLAEIPPFARGCTVEQALGILINRLQELQLPELTSDARL